MTGLLSRLRLLAKPISKLLTLLNHHASRLICVNSLRVSNPNPLPRLCSPTIRLPSFRVLPESPQSDTVLEVPCLTASIHVSETFDLNPVAEATVAKIEGQVIKRRTNKAKER